MDSVFRYSALPLRAPAPRAVPAGTPPRSERDGPAGSRPDHGSGRSPQRGCDPTRPASPPPDLSRSFLHAPAPHCQALSAGGAYLGLRAYACQRRAHSARPPRPRHIRAEQPRATGARSPPVVRNTHPPAVTGRSGDSGCVARSGGQASVCKQKDLPNKFNCPCILNNRKYARLWCPNAQLYLFQNFMSPIGCAEDFGHCPAQDETVKTGRAGRTVFCVVGAVSAGTRRAGRAGAGWDRTRAITRTGRGGQDAGARCAGYTAAAPRLAFA